MSLNVSKLLRGALKLAVVVAIAGAVVYKVYFAPVSVQAQKVAPGAVVAEAMGTGTLQARLQVTIGAQISGTLNEVAVDQGDRVTQGQLLAVLDDKDLRAQVDMAKADLAVANASLDRSASDIARAQSTLVLNEANLKRVYDLRSTLTVAAMEVDTATEQRDVAQANLKQAQTARIEADRQVAKAAESVRYYQERLAYTRIHSPFNGLVIHRNVDPGTVVVPGTAILQIVSTDQLWVSAWVDETSMAAIAPGQAARVVFRSDPEHACPGSVTRMAPQVDPETREFLVDVTVKDLPSSWAIGQRAEVYIQTARKDRTLVVPQRFILWQAGAPGVFVETAGRARWQPVSLGLRGRDVVEILAGLTDGQNVLLPRDSGAPLANGRAVRLP
jgi:HlyD family secretion protein